MSAVKPPDIDELARLLPRRELSGERAQRMRRALLDAAVEAPPPWWKRTPWLLGGAAAAAAAIALIVVYVASNRAPAGETPSVAAPAPARGSGQAIAIAPSTVERQLLDGVTTFHATQPLQLTRGSAGISAPPGARFEVEVRDGKVSAIRVSAGSVIFAPSASHSPTRIVEGETWHLPAPPPEVPPSTPREPPAPARGAVGSSVAPGALTTLPAPKRAERVAPAERAERIAALQRPEGSAASKSATQPAASERPERAPVTEQPAASERTAPPTAPERATPPPPTPPQQPPAAPLEREFRDGLHTLVAGRARDAIAPLDRACKASVSPEDACYWSAVASLRAGDRARALTALTDVLARWPDSTHAGEARVALGWLLLERGDRAGARARFTAAADDRVPAVRAEARRGLAAAQR